MSEPNKHLTSVVALGVLLFLGGCETTPHHEYNRAIDFRQYRTFSLMPFPTQGPPSDPGALLRLAQPAREALIMVLGSKGFIATDRDKADFVVNLRGESIPRVEVRDWGYTAYPMGYGRWGHHHYYVSPGPVEVSSTEERTLTIEVFDNKTKEPVWVGWKKDTGSSKVTAEKLQAAIAQILEPFPPGLPKSSAK